MTKDSFRNLFLDELRDIASAEHQIVSALPQVIQAASNAELKKALSNHLNETKHQVERLKTEHNQEYESAVLEAFKETMKTTEDFYTFSLKNFEGMKERTHLTQTRMCCSLSVVSGCGVFIGFAELFTEKEDCILEKEEVEEAVPGGSKKDSLESDIYCGCCCWLF